MLLPSMAAAQQVLLINPTPLPPPIDLSHPALVKPMLPNNPEGGLKLPDSTGLSLMPSLTMPPTDPIPSERSQQPVPALRLRIPL